MRKMTSIIAAAVCALLCLSGCKEEKKSEAVLGAEKSAGLKIGMTVQDLSNQVWSSTAVNLSKLVSADGGKLTYLDCSNNSSTQIQQLENFIANRMDVIIVHPVDKNSLEVTLANARKAGIKIFCWDEDVENADLCWLIDNYAEGKIVGEYAANWINEKLGSSAEIAILDYPQIEILLDRANGIVDAIKEKAPNAQIVAQSSAINPTEGMEKMETIFQKNPNVKVVACIGGGGAMGAVEAAKTSGKVDDTFGIFAVDGTEEELLAIKNGDGERMSILNTGTPEIMAQVIYDLVKQMQKGLISEKIVYRQAIPVTTENVDSYLKK